MAQTIKIRRGGIGAIGTSTPTTLKGELILATGSFSGGVLGTSLFAAEADDTLRLTHGRIDSVSDGAALATAIGNNDSFTGLLIHSASDNKLYRYSGTAFVELPIAAGSFVGTLGVDSGGTGQETLTDGAVLIGNGTSGIESVTMTNGQFLIGNSSDNPSAVDASTIAGAGLTATTGAGTATLNVDSGSFPINDLDTTTDLSVANGGTGVSTLTDHGVLVGSGTSPITALTVGTNGQLLIGQNGADPSFNTVSGVININNSGATTFTATANSAISGAFASTSASIAADITSNAADIDSNFSQININTTGISTNANSITALNAATSSYLQSADLAGVVSSSALSSPSQGTVTLTTNGVANNVDTGLQIGDSPQFTDLTLTGGDLIASTSTTFNVFNTTATTVNAFGAATSITIGASTGTATIKNATINLGETSGDIVNIKGNLNVAGTTTTIDSTTVSIGDRIIELNAGNAAGDGGILVRDQSGSQTGSLLWDAAGNYWKSGLATDGVGGGTLYRIPEFVSTTNITDNTLIVAGTSGRLEGSGKFTEDATNGIVADPKFTGLNASSTADTDRVVFVTSTGEVGQVVATQETTVVTTGLLGYDGTGLTFSSLIDGGTF